MQSIAKTLGSFYARASCLEASELQRKGAAYALAASVGRGGRDVRAGGGPSRSWHGCREDRGALGFQLPEEDMRLVGGLVSLSVSVPGRLGPAWAEDVYGLSRWSGRPQGHGPAEKAGPLKAVGRGPLPGDPDMHPVGLRGVERVPWSRNGQGLALRTNAAECAARGCGLRERGSIMSCLYPTRHKGDALWVPSASWIWCQGELVEERAVVCNDASNGARLPDARCEGAARCLQAMPTY